jgi:N-acylneuraminate cytidylyltransferase
MKVVALIPARGGSKRIPYKNIVKINDKPLICYVIEELLKTPEVDDIIISTDDNKISNIVTSHYGNKIIVLKRPSELATDESTTESVITDVIDKLKNKYTHMMLVQCTSPLTESLDFSVLISKVKLFNSATFYYETDSFFLDFEDDLINLTTPRLPSQNKKLRKLEAGNAWIFEIEGFLKYGSRLFGNIGICKIDSPKELEIDDPENLVLVECLLERRKNEQKSFLE